MAKGAEGIQLQGASSLVVHVPEDKHQGAARARAPQLPVGCIRGDRFLGARGALPPPRIPFNADSSHDAGTREQEAPACCSFSAMLLG